MTKTELKENITKINKLLRSDSYEAGIELIKTLDNPELNERLGGLIQKLDKKYFEEGKEEEYFEILSTLFPNLTSLNLSSCSFESLPGGLHLIPNLASLDLSYCSSLQNVDGLECCINITELYIDNAGILRNVNAIGNLKNLKSLLITNCPEILPEPKHKDMNTPEKVEEYQKMIEAIYKKGKIDIKTIVDDIDPDLLTTTLESFGDSLSDFNDHVLLLNITKKDLINKNFDNIIQVGYIRDYGDRDELDGLIWWYFKKCREWYGMYDLYSPISDQAAKKEAKTVWDEEKNYGNTSLILLYCEGEYVWAYGSY